MNNDGPKISPGAMKAAEKVTYYLISDRYHEGEIGEVAQIINTATNLTDKEEALRDMIRLVELYTEVVTKFGYLHPDDDKRVNEGITKAKKALNQ